MIEDKGHSEYGMPRRSYAIHERMPLRMSLSDLEAHFKMLHISLMKSVTIVKIVCNKIMYYRPEGC